MNGRISVIFEIKRINELYDLTRFPGVSLQTRTDIINAMGIDIEGLTTNEGGRFTQKQLSVGLQYLLNHESPHKQKSSSEKTNSPDEALLGELSTVKGFLEKVYSKKGDDGIQCKEFIREVVRYYIDINCKDKMDGIQSGSAQDKSTSPTITKALLAMTLPCLHHS